MNGEKKNVIEQTANDFSKMDADNKMFILGYMLGVQKEKERTEQQKKSA